MMSSAWCCHGVDASSLGCPWDKRRSGCHDVVRVEELLARIHEMNFPAWTGEAATWVFVVRENRPVNGNDHVKLDGFVFVEPWWLKLKPVENKDKKSRQKQKTTNNRDKYQQNHKQTTTRNRQAMCKQQKQFCRSDSTLSPQFRVQLGRWCVLLHQLVSRGPISSCIVEDHVRVEHQLFSTMGVNECLAS